MALRDSCKTPDFNSVLCRRLCLPSLWNRHISQICNSRPMKLFSRLNVQSSMLETSSLKSRRGTGGGGTQAILLTPGNFPQALAVYATKGYSSCVSRRSRNAAMAQRFVKLSWGAPWHFDIPPPYSQSSMMAHPYGTNCTCQHYWHSQFKRLLHQNS